MVSETVTISAKYKFNETEKRENGERLAQFSIRKGELCEAKKINAQRFKEQIDTVKQQIESVSMNIANGYEYREYKCRVEYDYKKKRKSYFDIHTGDKVDEREFDQDDFQRKLEI